MAIHEITHSCGHTERHDLFGKRRQREWREVCLSAEPCTACRVAERERQNAEKAVDNADFGLPQLRGSEKQVAWAEAIRHGIIRHFEGVCQVCALVEAGQANAHTFEGEEAKKILQARNISIDWGFRAARALAQQVGDGGHEAFFTVLCRKTSASWWIDHRTSYDEVMREVVKEITTTVPAAPDTGEASAAMAEAIIKPEGTAASSSFAEVRQIGGSIAVCFPEKNDAFREVMHAQGMKWNSDKMRWEVSINWKVPDVVDRMAEIAHRIVQAGFAVALHDQQARARALDGSFTPHQTRWVAVSVSGKYAGYLSLCWQRPDDFYTAARSLPRSRYSNGYVYVPAGAIEAVAEFADEHDFSLSPAALEMLEAHRAAMANGATLTKSMAAPVPVSGMGSASDVILPVPESCEVDPSLKDD